MAEADEGLRRLGAHLRELRNAKGLSQERLGFECELSQTYISEVETGKRNISFLNLRAIAKALGISMAELMSGID